MPDETELDSLSAPAGSVKLVIKGTSAEIKSVNLLEYIKKQHIEQILCMFKNDAD